MRTFPALLIMPSIVLLLLLQDPGTSQRARWKRCRNSSTGAAEVYRRYLVSGAGNSIYPKNHTMKASAIEVWSTLSLRRCIRSSKRKRVLAQSTAKELNFLYIRRQFGFFIVFVFYGSSLESRKGGHARVTYRCPAITFQRRHYLVHS